MDGFTSHNISQVWNTPLKANTFYPPPFAALHTGSGIGASFWVSPKLSSTYVVSFVWMTSPERSSTILSESVGSFLLLFLSMCGILRSKWWPSCMFFSQIDVQPNRWIRPQHLWHLCSADWRALRPGSAAASKKNLFPVTSESECLGQGHQPIEHEALSVNDFLVCEEDMQWLQKTWHADHLLPTQVVFLLCQQEPKPQGSIFAIVMFEGPTPCEPSLHIRVEDHWLLDICVVYSETYGRPVGWTQAQCYRSDNPYAREGRVFSQLRLPLFPRNDAQLAEAITLPVLDMEHSLLHAYLRSPRSLLPACPSSSLSPA